MLKGPRSEPQGPSSDGETLGAYPSLHHPLCAGKLRGMRVYLPRRSHNLVCLHRRALDVSIRTEYATITGMGLQHRVTTHAFVEELAGVSWHLCTLCRTALWARQRRRGSKAHISSEGNEFTII